MKHILRAERHSASQVESYTTFLTVEVETTIMIVRTMYYIKTVFVLPLVSQHKLELVHPGVSCLNRLDLLCIHCNVINCLYIEDWSGRLSQLQT